MSTYLLLTLGFLYTFLLYSSSYPTENLFYQFKLCLVARSFDTSRIVERANSTLYLHLDFQKRLRPPIVHPRAIVLVTTETEVVTVVTCGQQTNQRVVPRSGGHSFEKYSSGNNESVVIDLRLLNAVTFDNFTFVATVGAGALAGEVAMVLWNTARVHIPISTCPTVGMSGVATGGGYGYLSRTYGLTTDYILGFNIVTADGQLLKVDNTTNADLFWAVRGGGAVSFGVVTQMRFKVLPAPSWIFFANVVFPLDSFVSVFKAFQGFALDGSRTITGKMHIEHGQISIDFIDPTGTDTNYEQLAKSFPQGNTTKRWILSYPDFLVFVAAGNIPKGVQPQDLLTVGRTTIDTTSNIVKSFYQQKLADADDLEELSSFFKKAAVDPKVSFAFQAYGGAINDLTVSETAFPHRTGSVSLAIVYIHSTTEDGLRLEKTLWAEPFFTIGEKICAQKSSYQNYVDGDLTDYLVRYYGYNLGKLVDVKRKYDPDNYFWNPQSIPTHLEGITATP